MAEVGAAGLTFDAAAKAAGITKGGVQYCFGTKSNLIRAMIARWGDTFEDRVLERAGSTPTPKKDIFPLHGMRTRRTTRVPP